MWKHTYLCMSHDIEEQDTIFLQEQEFPVINKPYSFIDNMFLSSSLSISVMYFTAIV